MKGCFITLEGIEGAGKSTLALALRDALHAKGLRVELTREPGGTPLAERLRDLVLTRGEEHVSPEAETLIMFASRAVHLDNLVRPALARGTWVICDRFTDATRAYQGGGRGVRAEFIEQLAHTVHAGLEPDLTLLLDLPVEEGLRRAARRRADRGDHTDRFESETVAFFSRVRARYLQIADSEARCQRIDALQPAAVVQAQALEALSRLLEQAE
ncbi:MAG: dTMP kinase [Gammaproteobacteria bacterium]|nr:dTMP kinase [Gammaproteobacteria bacterium]